MTLAERLATAGATSDYQPARASAPSGWEPGVRYEPSGAMLVTVPLSATLAGEDEWREAVQGLGVEIPPGWRLRLVEARYDPAAWHRDAQGEDAVTRPVWRYRFAVEPAPRTIDVDELVRDAKAGRRRPRAATETATVAYTVCTSDLQIGKPDGDGTPGTVARFFASHERALDRYKALRRRGQAGEDVVLVWPGDCIEGTETQGSRLLARLDCTITEQVRIYRRLMLHQVKAYLDAGARARVLVVPGNHDEAKRVGDQMATRYDDSWAIEGAAAVADALEVAGYDDTQVAFTFPGRDELTVTVDVAGTVVGVLHGHQTKGKLQGWLAGQALGRQAIGSADLVISGHYHHLRVEQIGPVTHVQVPTLDGGSTWWKHRTGLEAPPGTVTLLVGGGSWSSMEVL